MAGTWNTTHDFDLPAASRSATANDTAELGFEVFLKLLPSNIVLTVLICLGIPGNLLVLIVYFKKFKVSSTRVFVLAMATCDLFVTLVAPVHFIYFRFMYSVSDSFCRVFFLLLKFPVIVSCWTLVCASLDRRHRVCQPLRRQLSARQALYVLVIPLGLAILATVPFAAFRSEVTFTTNAGLVLKKCTLYSGSESGKVNVKKVEGSVLTVYSIVGLILLVWAYSHILFSIKRQNKRKRDNFAHDTKRAETLGSASSAPKLNVVLDVKTDTSLDTCDNITEEACTSRDLETCDERPEVNSSDQRAQKPKTRTGEAIEEGRQLTGRPKVSRKSLTSKTTLVMFVLTVTNAVCLLPYTIWKQSHDTFYEPEMSSWTMNLFTVLSYLPSVRSTASPLIYIYFNPKFRQQCLRFLTGVTNFHHYCH